MSLLFGYYSKEGIPVSNKEMELMYSAISHFPHKKFNYKTVGNIGFGHLLAYSTPEDKFEKMPIWHEDRQLLFVCESRLDNRQELISQLSVEESSIKSDGHLTFQAYLKWGQEIVSKLLGDWSLAAFHAKTNELFIARDHHGATAIDYYDNSRLLAFSSSIKCLLSLPSISLNLDEMKVVQNLTTWLGKGDKSIYQEIKHLPPAHFLSTIKNKTSIHRYWDPELTNLIYGKQLKEYAGEFKEILIGAIKSRLRSERPIASMLSGGLDSTTVSILAAQMLGTQNKKLLTISHIPAYEPSGSLPKGWIGDESEYIKATVRASENMKSIMLDSKEFSPLAGMNRMLDVVDEPFHAAANAFWLSDILNYARNNGVGSLLSAANGNANISWYGVNNFLPLIHYLQAFGISRFLRHRLIGSLFKGRLSSIYKRHLGTKTPWEDVSFLNSSLADEIDILELMRNDGHDPKHDYHFAHPKENMSLILMPGKSPRSYYGALFSNYFGVDWRDPTSDKRVIEYAYSIPNEMFINSRGEGKQVLKCMMKDILPDQVLYARDKGQQSSDVLQRVLIQSEEFDEAIIDFRNNPLITRFIDFKKFINYWGKIKKNTSNEYDIYKFHHFLRTFMTAMFLSKQ